MSITKVLAVYVLTLLTFLACDAVWLGVIARGLYQRELGHLMAPQVRWGAAAVFYLLFVAGVLVLVVLPHRQGALTTVAALGAFLGVVAYATYDLTNLATLRDFPVIVTVVDMIWGGVLTAVTASAGWLYARWLLF